MTAVVKTFEWALCSCYVVQPLQHFPSLQGVSGAEGHALQESRQTKSDAAASKSHQCQCFCVWTLTLAGGESGAP